MPLVKSEIELLLMGAFIAGSHAAQNSMMKRDNGTIQFDEVNIEEIMSEYVSDQMEIIKEMP